MATNFEQLSTIAQLPELLLTWVLFQELEKKFKFHGLAFFQIYGNSPLWKNKGDKSEQKCYRPIALLPVLEKFVSRWLNSYLEVNRLWSDRQHGYRQHRSTSTALLQLQEEILKRHEEGLRGPLEEIPKN